MDFFVFASVVVVVVVYLIFQLTKSFVFPKWISTEKKAILVTGCDSGFGLELCLRAAKSGFVVIACCLDLASDGIVLLNDARCRTIQVDVTRQKSIDEALAVTEQALKEEGCRLHGLVNNAGVNLSVGPVEWAAPETVARVLDVNTLGAVRIVRTFLPLIRKAGGRIVNVCSMASHVAAPNVIPYSISKAATMMFTHGLRKELKPFGVHVVSVSPNLYRTPATSSTRVVACVDRTWSEATTSAKSDYGISFHRSLRDEAGMESPFMRNETVEVVDCLMDALLNKNPPWDYVPDIASRIVKFFLGIVPLSWVDYLRLKMVFSTLIGIIVITYLALKLYHVLNPSFISAKNKAILITGCDSGFGLQLGHRAFDAGFHVFAGCLSGDSEGAKQLKEIGCSILLIDVTRQKTLDEALIQVERDSNAKGITLHGIVNNAGVNLNVGPVEWAAPESIAGVFDVNTMGVVRVTRTFLPLVRKAKGRIVNVCSMAAHVAAPRILPYSMSKAATFFYTNGLRRDLKDFGVHVASISPIYYATNIVSRELVKKCVEKSWSEANSLTKADYGTGLYNHLIQNTDKDLIQSRYQTWEVIDCMMDALTNQKPKCDYVPDIRTRLFKFGVDMIPLSWCDNLTVWSERYLR